ncbi:reverse transcriptase domain-containing protein, partial [Tanacetum coccineum]
VNFADECPSTTNTEKIMAQMDAMTMKMDAQYKELQSRPKQSTTDQNVDDIPMSWEEEVKFMQTFRKTRFYNDYRDRNLNRDNWRSSERNDYNRDNYRSNTDDKSYDLQKQFNDFMKAQQSTNTFVKETFMDLKAKLETVPKNHQASIQNLETKFDKLTGNLVDLLVEDEVVKRGWDAQVFGEAPHKFKCAVEAIKTLRQAPGANDQYLPPFVIVDDS